MVSVMMQNELHTVSCRILRVPRSLLINCSLVDIMYESLESPNFLYYASKDADVLVFSCINGPEQ